MLRLLGGALVLLASGSFGITAGVRYYRAARHLQAFCHAVELLRCEINYSLQPLPEVCALVADRLTGPPAAFFRCFAAQLREPVSRDRAAAAALEAARGLQLPQDAVMAVLELCSALGRYDLDGENRMLDLTAKRLQAALARCEAVKRRRAQCYAALGRCRGVALVLLAVLPVAVQMIFKVAAVGIIVTILNQVLVRSGREEQATMTTLAGLVVVLMIVAQKIAQLFDLVQSLFRF